MDLARGGKTDMPPVSWKKSRKKLKTLAGITAKHVTVIVCVLYIHQYMEILNTYTAQHLLLYALA